MKVRAPPRVHFSHGQLFGESFDTKQLEKKRDNSCGLVLYVNSMGSLWIIFYFINISWELWALVLCYFGVSWVMPKAFMALFPSWKGNVDKFNKGKFGWQFLLSLMWCIWREETYVLLRDILVAHLNSLYELTSQ